MFAATVDIPRADPRLSTVDPADPERYIWPEDLDPADPSVTDDALYGRIESWLEIVEAFGADRGPGGAGEPPLAEVAAGAALALRCESQAAVLDTLDDGGLLALVEAAERVTRWAAGLRTRAIAEYADRHPVGTSAVPPGGSAASAVTRWVPAELGMTLHLSRLEAQSLIGSAQRLAHVLPDTLDALQAGRIDERRADTISYATRTLPHDKARAVEAAVLAKADGATPRQVYDRTRRAVHRVDPDGEYRRHQVARTERRVTMQPREEGMASLWAYGPAAECEATFTMLTRLARSLGADDPRTLDQRRFDLLGQVVQGRITVTDLEALITAVGGADADPAGASRARADNTDADDTDADSSGAATGGADRRTNSDSDDADADDSDDSDDAKPAHDADSAEAGDTDAGDTDAGDTDAGDTDAGDTDAGDTDAGDTDAGDTDAADADADETDVGAGRAHADMGTGRANADGAAPIPLSDETMVAIAAAALARQPRAADTVRKPLIQVVVGLDTLLGSDRPGELIGHGPIPAVTARALAAGGSLARIVTDPLSGQLLDYGRKTYAPPAGLADFVRARDQVCRGPGCTRLIRDLDHRQRWDRDGHTADVNLDAYCRSCHVLKELDGWHVLAHPDGRLTWVSPAGRTHTTAPYDYRPFTDDVPAADSDGDDAPDHAQVEKTEPEIDAPF